MTRRDKFEPSNDPRIVELLRWLRERSRQREHAPTNTEICEHFDLRSVSSAAALVHRAERAGVVDVDRRQRGRVFSFSTLSGKPTSIATATLDLTAHVAKQGKNKL